MNTNTRYAQTLNAAIGENKLAFVEVGYGQVEPNHLSAQRTGQIYAQLPAAENISVLQQGQFVKYDYANEVCNFTGRGEWMLVYNEIKLYREGQNDCEFALVKNDYNARIYSPYGFDVTEGRKLQSRYYNGVDAEGNNGYEFAAKYALTTDKEIDSTKTYYTQTIGTTDDDITYTAVTTPDASRLSTYFEEVEPAKTYSFDRVTVDPTDIYEMFQTGDPYHIIPGYKEKKMPTGTKMVPRVFKTNIGDIFTTNTVKDMLTAENVGQSLYVGDDGILTLNKSTNSGDMEWQIVKFYTMPDGQKGVKLMRIA